MVVSPNVDEQYAAFCRDLPLHLREVAQTLAFQLRLVPRPTIPWSATFKHAVTLQAPTLLTRSMPGVTESSVAAATSAHMLAVIEAFGTDRILDGQVPDTPALREVLEHARRLRNRHLKALGGTPAVALAAVADEQTTSAIAEERRLFIGGAPVTMATYERVSAGKQAVGLPASLVLAASAGWDDERSDLVRDALMGVWLGLQFQDDVADWEDDARQGGAWAVLLARGIAPTRSVADDSTHDLVHGSGVLVMLLEAAARRFEAAHIASQEIGATELADWAAERARGASAAARGERASPGYVRRSMALAPWLAEVMA